MLVRPSTRCDTYPFSSSRLRTVRHVDSFIKCRFANASRTSSAVTELRCHTTRITICSKLLSGFCELIIVALHNVATYPSGCKANLWLAFTMRMAEEQRDYVREYPPYRSSLGPPRPTLCIADNFNIVVECLRHGNVRQI